MKKISILIISTIILVLGLNFINNQINFLYGSKRIFLEKEFPMSVNLMYNFLTENRQTNLKNLNDYNVKFLPNTQTINLNFKKIKIDQLKEVEQGYKANIKRKRYAFNFSRFKNFLIIASADAQILSININDLELEKINTKKILHNLNSDKYEIKDILVNNNNIFVSSSTKLNDNCSILEIYKSEINNIQKLNFIKIFSSSECALNIQGGRIQILENDDKDDFILITTSADILKNKDESDGKPPSDNSIFGKIIQINLNNNSYNIFSKGHRNSLGLHINNEEKIILQTENGPCGGDEINLIKKGFNYGWDIASYGTKYSDTENLKNTNYKLNHEEYGFEEPIYSFIPSIGITEIIKIEKNFTNKWENNYLIGSLNSKHLYRVKFDLSYSKVLFFEKIFIGERIRDLFYLKDERKILIAMEESGSIGIIENKNQEN